MLKITSIFLSVNGECCEAGPGSWTVFVRTYGCSAKCSYCDTKYSHEEGCEYKEMSAKEVFGEIIKLDPGCKRVTLTGGEPLEQNTNDLIELVYLLTKLDYSVSIETNGMQMERVRAIKDSIIDVNADVTFVVDFKLPSSGKPWEIIVGKKYSHEYMIEWWSDRSYSSLTKYDTIKMVISNKEDFDWAMKVSDHIAKKLQDSPKIYFSPVGCKAPGLLFEWMKEAGCAEKNIGYSMQIHKLIFPGDWRDEEKI